MTRVNKWGLLVVAALLLLEASSLAQEREPLVMRIELEWSVAGSVLGSVIGTALWLTDPGNPNNTLARQVIEGAALGAFVGAALGIYQIQRNMQLPGNAAAWETPPALWGTGADPVAVRDKREASMASAPPNRPQFTLAALQVRF